MQNILDCAVGFCVYDYMYIYIYFYEYMYVCVCVCLNSRGGPRDCFLLTLNLNVQLNFDHLADMLHERSEPCSHLHVDQMLNHAFISFFEMKSPFKWQCLVRSLTSCIKVAYINKLEFFFFRWLGAPGIGEDLGSCLIWLLFNMKLARGRDKLLQNPWSCQS